VPNGTVAKCRASSECRCGSTYAGDAFEMNVVLEEQTMQASFELKRSPDRIAIAGLAMLATLIVGGASGYAVKS
jgi:hypothetical protein